MASQLLGPFLKESSRGKAIQGPDIVKKACCAHPGAEGPAPEEEGVMMQHLRETPQRSAGSRLTESSLPWREVRIQFPHLPPPTETQREQERWETAPCVPKPPDQELGDPCLVPAPARSAHDFKSLSSRESCLHRGPGLCHLEWGEQAGEVSHLSLVECPSHVTHQWTFP